MIARLFIGCLVILAVGQAESKPKAEEPNLHDLIQCHNKPGDTDLVMAQIVDAGHYLGKVDIDFIYPPEGAPANKVINCITVKDLDPSLGGTVEITDGGIGTTNVTIKMNSAFTKGVNFSVHLMGQPRKG